MNAQVNGISLATSAWYMHLAPAGADLLVDGDGHVAAVERQHREEVEDPDEDVDDDEDVEEVADAGLDGVGGRLRRSPTIDWARVPLAAAWLAALALVDLVEALGDRRWARTGGPMPDDRGPGHAAELGPGARPTAPRADRSGPASRG